MGWMLRSGRREVSMPLRSFVIGRGREADLQLDDEGVSRRHAKLNTRADGAAAIEDLGSQNGTFVNGRLIVGSTRLSEGDRIRVGSSELELVAVFAELEPGIERPTEPLSRVPFVAEPAGVDPLSLLSPREREVFAMLAEGATRRDIATRFGVSLKTVETHRTRIGQKLQIRSRAELIRTALAAGVLKSDP